MNFFVRANFFRSAIFRYLEILHNRWGLHVANMVYTVAIRILTPTILSRAYTNVHTCINLMEEDISLANVDVFLYQHRWNCPIN